MKDEYRLNVKNLQLNTDSTQAYLNPKFKPYIVSDKISIDETSIDEMLKINKLFQSKSLSLMSDVSDILNELAQKMAEDMIFRHLPQEFLKPEYRKSIDTNNTNKKEDDRMKSKTMKNFYPNFYPNDGAKNRMGVFSEGVLFDTPSGTTQYIIPQITDIKVINNRVVIIKFKDGTQEKAVLSSEDTFSLEQGISICITKKILSQLTYGNGSSAYNKLIDYAMKVYNKNEKEKKAIEKSKEKAAQKAQKYEEKRNKRKAKQRNEQIEILSEAISRAMNNTDSKNQ